MNWLLIPVTALALFYVASISVLIYGLHKLPEHVPCKNRPKVSVIVAVRNEKDHIVHCLDSLLQQTYPQDKYEIIVIDDHSTDGTAEILAEYSKRHSRIQIIYQTIVRGQTSPKKQAVHAGIMQATGEWILTTDADCIAPPCWIATMMAAAGQNTAFIASWLQVDANGHLLGRLESLDSLAFVLTGAAAFGLGKPVLANAANMGYRKDVYLAVGGFSGGEHLGSGDDDLLLQKIASHNTYNMRFVNDANNTIWTPANANLAGFVRQRVRWASKSAVYSPSLTLFLVLIALCFALPLPILLLVLFNQLGAFALALPLVKLGMDMAFMYKGCTILCKPFSLKDLLLTELLQLLYLFPVALLGKVGRFQWKGRCYSKGILQESRNAALGQNQV